MLQIQGLQIQLFNSFIDPLIQFIAGESKVKELSVKFCIAGLLGGASNLFFKVYERTSNFLSQAGKISFYSIIFNLLHDGMNKIEEVVESQLEKYNLEESFEFISPIMEITAGIALRQAAGFALDLPSIPNPFASSKNTPTINLEQVTIHGSDIHTSINSTGVLNKISSVIKSCFNGIFNVGFGIINFGKSNSYNENNFVSDSLDACGQNMFLGGLFKLGVATYKWFSGGNKVNGLSVYDVKKILSEESKGQYDKEQLKQASTMLFQQMQSSEQYCEKIKSTEPKKFKEIEVVTNLYSKLYGNKIKENYKAFMPEKLFDKTSAFVDIQMKMEVTHRVIQAKENKSTIKEYTNYGLSLNVQEKNIIKYIAQQTINAEIKQINDLIGETSDEENSAFKNLFLQSKELEIECEMLNKMLFKNSESFGNFH